MSSRKEKKRRRRGASSPELLRKKTEMSSSAREKKGGGGRELPQKKREEGIFFADIFLPIPLAGFRGRRGGEGLVYLTIERGMGGKGGGKKKRTLNPW